MITIRDATISDVSWLVGELRSFDRFLGLKTRSLVPSNDADAMEKVAHLVDTQPFFVADSAESGDHHGPEASVRAGFIAGMLAPQFWNASIMQLTELAWWVTPGFRGTSAGARLLQHFNEYGDKYADVVALSVLENTPLDADALVKRGFHLHERSYLREVQHA